MAAILSGWRVAAFAAGSLGIHLVNRRLAFIPRSKRTEMEGFVLPLPASAVVFTRVRNAVIDASGPVISLLVAAVGLAIGLSSRDPLGSFDPAGLALGIGVLSLIVAAHTIVPIVPNDRPVDGQRFVRGLRMNDALWRKYRAFGSLHTLTRYQVRLRDLPLWMLVEASREAANDEDLTKAYECMVIGIVLDSPPVDTIETRKLLDTFRAKHGGSAWLDSCDAYFTAVWEGDADQARARQWGGDGDEEMRPMILAADAAVAARWGDARTTRLLLTQMREAVRKKSIFPDLTFRDIGRQIEAALAEQNG